MFQHILVCCDGSASAEQAAQAAASLARKSLCGVTLLYVLDLNAVLPPAIGVWEGAAGPREIAHYRRRAREVVEQEAAKPFIEAGLSYNWRFEIGYPVEKIVDVAEEEEADLIVLGSRGIGGWKRLLLGSVSEGVLHHAHCPVLLVQGANGFHAKEGFEHILLASDGSPSAGHAARVAAEIAQAYATSMHTLNVVEPFSFGPVLSDEDYALLVSGDPANVAGRYLAQVKASIGSALTEVGVFCTFHQEHGVAEEKIVQFAQEHGSDLIVMGSRGLGGFERMLLGSVSNYVAYHAPCPVLIVR